MRACLFMSAYALLAPTRDRWGMPMIQGTWANRVRLGSKPRVDMALSLRKGAFANLLSCCHLLQISLHPSVELCVCEVCRCLAVGIAQLEEQKFLEKPKGFHLMMWFSRRLSRRWCLHTDNVQVGHVFVDVNTENKYYVISQIGP